MKTGYCSKSVSIQSTIYKDRRSVSFLAPLSENSTVRLFSWIRPCWMSRGFPTLLFQPAVTMEGQCVQRHSSHFRPLISLWWLLQIFPSISSLLCSRRKVYFLLQNWLSLWQTLSSILTDVHTIQSGSTSYSILKRC